MVFPIFLEQSGKNVKNMNEKVETIPQKVKNIQCKGISLERKKKKQKKTSILLTLFCAFVIINP